MFRVCRTCLKQITAADFVSIDDPTDGLSSGSVGVKLELAMCIPELDLDVVTNAVVCTACVSDLHTSYSFKSRCLQTEEKLQSYIQANATDSTHVDLNHLISCGDNTDCSDPLTLANIKEEPAYSIKYEESFENTTFEENFIKTESIFANMDNFSNEVPCRSDENQLNVNKDAPPTLENKTATKYKCNPCNEEFSSFRSFNAHKKTHTLKVPYKCTRCDYSTSQSKDLIRHVQTHTKHPTIVSSTTTKRKTFTIEDKVDLIRKLEGGKKISEVCRETGLATSTVCCIWKSKDTILSAFEKNGPHLKRLRKPIHADVDEALFIWFKEQGSDGPISGPLLKAKAEELARAMGNYDFVCSGSWLDRFKARYNICFAKKRC